VKNTLYIAEPLYSERLQRFDPEAAFPPIKKIGITTDLPQRRERELLGTLSPVKVSIVRAWTGIDARSVESMLHTILDNSRLDGEYFWDGNETLVEAVCNFMESYHPEAKRIQIGDDADVKEASEAAEKRKERRVFTEVVPCLERLGIEPRVAKNEKGVRFGLGDYKFQLAGRTGGKYTLTIWSHNKSTEDALRDFPGAQELAAHGTEDSPRRARISMASLQAIAESLSEYMSGGSSNEALDKSVGSIGTSQS